jgi:ElaB/YqjD/DUF883 family membrane-anchored ribosome-binding protein
MAPRTYEVFRDREEIHASLRKNLELLEERVDDTIAEAKSAVKRAVDPRYHVARRPWKTLGVAVLVGYTLGTLFSGKSANGKLDGKRRPARETNQTPSDLREISLVTLAIKRALLGVVGGIVSDMVKNGLPGAISYLRKAGSQEAAAPPNPLSRSQAEPPSDKTPADR